MGKKKKKKKRLTAEEVAERKRVRANANLAVDSDAHAPVFALLPRTRLADKSGKRKLEGLKKKHAVAINALGPCGASPLMVACLKAADQGNAAEIERLLELGANPCTEGRQVNQWGPWVGGKRRNVAATQGAGAGPATTVDVRHGGGGGGGGDGVGGGGSGSGGGAAAAPITPVLSAAAAVAAADVDDFVLPENTATFEVAMSYMAEVKFQFRKRIHQGGLNETKGVYDEFLGLMKEYNKSAKIDLPGMIKRVNELFAGHANLITGFNAFLPPAHARTGSRQFKVRGINAFPLLICCQTINVEVLKILLAHDSIDVNQATSDAGTTALYAACGEGHVEIIKLLLSHKDIQCNKRCDGIAPLHSICSDVVRWELEYESVRHSSQDIPLKMLKCLLAQDGVDVNVRVGNGDHFTVGSTPLHILCKDHSFGKDMPDWQVGDFIEALVAHRDIDVNAKDGNGCTPLSLLCQSLIESDPNGNDTIRNARNAPWQHIDTLLEHTDMEVNVDERTRLLLYNACCQLQPRVVEILLKTDGIDAYVNDAAGPGKVTPLQAVCSIFAGFFATEFARPYECREDQTRIIEALLLHPDVDVNERAKLNRNSAGKGPSARSSRNKDQSPTPLHEAVDHASGDSIRLLMLHGASLTATNDKNQTALDCCEEDNYEFYGGFDDYMSDEEGGFGSFEEYLEEHPMGWFRLMCEWSQLKIAAAIRKPKHLKVALRSGRINPDIYSTEEIEDAIVTANLKPSSLPWVKEEDWDSHAVEGPLPVCSATIKLITAATRAWHQSAHWSYHGGVANAVFTVLVVGERLDKKVAAEGPTPPESTPPPKLERRLTRGAAAAATAAGVAHTQLPLLPPEMWMLVLGFFRRSWWSPESRLV